MSGSRKYSLQFELSGVHQHEFLIATTLARNVRSNEPFDTRGRRLCNANTLGFLVGMPLIHRPVAHNPGWYPFARDVLMAWMMARTGRERP